MGREVLEGLRVSQSQQRPLSRKINKRIMAHPVSYIPTGKVKFGREGEKGAENPAVSNPPLSPSSMWNIVQITQVKRGAPRTGINHPCPASLNCEGAQLQSASSPESDSINTRCTRVKFTTSWHYRHEILRLRLGCVNSPQWPDAAKRREHATYTQHQITCLNVVKLKNNNTLKLTGRTKRWTRVPD